MSVFTSTSTSVGPAVNYDSSTSTEVIHLHRQ